MAFSLMPSSLYGAEVLDSIVSYYSDNTPKEKIEYRYDDNGYHSATIIYTHTEKEGWKENTKNEYVNDSKGNVISDVAYSVVVSGGKLFLSGKKEYVYDTEGRIDTMKHYTKSGNLSYITRYFYYENGNIKWTIDYSLKNGVFESGSRIEYCYKNGLLTSKICYGNDKTVAVDCRWKYEYSYDSGNLTLSRYFTYSNNAWKWTKSIKYEYDKLNRLYCQTQTQSQSSVLYSGSMIKYKYDTNDAVVSEEQYIGSYDGSEWKFLANAIYYYHNSDQISQLKEIEISEVDGHLSYKRLSCGQFFIIDGDKSFDLCGREVKKP